VADPNVSVHGVFLDRLCELGDSSYGFPHLNATAIPQRDARGIISPVFETAKAVHEDREGVGGADVGDDSTHIFEW
jgi:hypothetical protein